ncbi:hypothetical protein FFLO_05033 [Filobasidium floriforme]|uniref:Uncharacterized protein n=1 Tax=Filobasidium floriforme TaxID=5210 RepID=A0A8K0NPB4_9TREE|nr:uncharacterized protein HD553DRAFT_326758 [Filobasidium floriforme]KAG7530434.1 hypothetical protein FFLO_05033 [Filobasidium floriforme]KAH8078561.1 hypothetical protein HD553DRAFT_326758 [Filobasidium floriforme]
MPKDSRFRWSNLIDDICRNVCHEIDSTGQVELLEQQWRIFHDQLKEISARPSGEFPSKRPCKVFDDGAKAYEYMQANDWKQYYLTPSQLGILRDHMIRVYKFHLLNFMANDLVTYSILSTKAFLFQEMMCEGLYNCAAESGITATVYGRNNNRKIQQFANSLSKGTKEGQPGTLQDLRVLLTSHGLPGISLLSFGEARLDTLSALEETELSLVTVQLCFVILCTQIGPQNSAIVMPTDCTSGLLVCLDLSRAILKR